MILAALCIAIALMWGGEIATLRTVSQVDDNQYLYQMEYKADYDLDEVHYCPEKISLIRF